MTRKATLLAAMVVLASAIVWASGSQEPKAGAAKGPIHLTFRQNDPPGQIAGLQQAVDKWNTANPDINVTLQSSNWNDAQNQWVREVQSKSGPDVAQVAFVWTADLGRNGLLADLTPLIKSSPPGAGIADFLATDLATVDGKIYGLPWTVDTTVMAYRPDMLQAAGISQFPDTWDELFTVAKKLTRDTNGDGKINQYGFTFPGGSGPSGAIWFLVNDYLWGNGMTFVKQDSQGKWQVPLTTDQMAGVMNYFNRFFTEGVTPKSDIAVSWEGDPQIIDSLARGDAAIVGDMRLISFRQVEKDSAKPVRMALMPRGNLKRVSQLGGRTLGINPYTAYTDASWKFIKYMSSLETFKTYNQFPAQKALLDQIEKTLPPAEQPYAEQLKFGVTFHDYIVSPA
ncbi:MAG TPA: sugar ABC transporter substrate-binding protein, partial [Spirochaetia bacterium]|nr:sugar ABC transporter substrate-binding protein [Spirochaetia bacterium]